MQLSANIQLLLKKNIKHTRAVFSLGFVVPLNLLLSLSILQFIFDSFAKTLIIIIIISLFPAPPQKKSPFLITVTKVTNEFTKKLKKIEKKNKLKKKKKNVKKKKKKKKKKS